MAALRNQALSLYRRLLRAAKGTWQGGQEVMPRPSSRVDACSMVLPPPLPPPPRPCRSPHLELSPRCPTLPNRKPITSGKRHGSSSRRTGTTQMQRRWPKR